MALELLIISKTQAVAFLGLGIALFKIAQISLQLHRRRQFARQHGCEPITRHYPHTFPYLRFDRMRAVKQARENHRHLEWIASTYRELGTYTLDFRVPNLQTIISTAEPANCKAMFATQFNDFNSADRLYIVGPLIGKGIFTTDGEEWRHSRAMIRPNFARTQISNIDAVERFLQDMFKLLPRDGTTVDLQPLFFSLTADTATEFLFGESVHTLRGDEPGKPSGTAFVKAYDSASLQCVMRATQPSLWAMLMGPTKEDRQNCKTVAEFVQRYVDQALEWRRTWKDEKETPTGQYTFLFELAKETADPEKLKGEVLNLLLAGRDTTASLLGSMFFHLAKRPDIYERLQGEVRELKGERPGFEQLKDMKLLQWCMKETLRVNTVVPTVSRNANRDTTLPVGGGKDGKSPIFVKAGQMVFAHVSAMHLREDIWGPTAKTWDPDRWATARHAPWEYIPFHGGPRVCLGQQFALTEAGYVTARMLQTFSKLESRDDGPWQEKVDLSCASRQTLASLTRA
ncbi:putative cytochrome P450 [Bimuria novae-zelandiae CBS 107.79]|uniref:Putative cytochrome P450 n=1 Tax=Bimuria novae-zelandiae CBS 107.79 TaxID=1447943 RepID=A0A6A5VBH8_9PLEO|nr:putative cytochrome P450 [Bimuria novae-zelandiae CBS 107.79]